MNKIGNFISEARINKNLSIKELAESLFVNPSTVKSWEKGSSVPDITALKSLAKILDVDVAEILYGEHNHKEKINIPEKIKEIKKEIKKEQAKKRNIFLSIIFIVILFITIYYLFPKSIKNGTTAYKIKSNIDIDGLAAFNEIVSKTKNKTAKYNITKFKIELDNNANIKNFILALNCFNEEEQYLKSIFYKYENNKLTYEDSASIKALENIEYNSSLSIENLSNEIKRIPMKEQIDKSKWQEYYLEFDNEKSIMPNIEFLDCRTKSNEIKSYTMEEYITIKKNATDNDTGILIRFTKGNILDFHFTYLFGYLTDYKELFPETDYYINNDNLKFTRNNGITWINADITKEELKNTLNFYNSSINLLPNSYFISSNKELPIAYFYGENPILKITHDNGKTWSNIDFSREDFEKKVTKRVIGFTSKNNGYAALGTDWTMGTGELKYIYLTNNGGLNWTKLTPPDIGTSNTLSDLLMLDEKIGVLILRNPYSEKNITVYTTKDSCASWDEVTFDKLDEENYFSDAYRITYESNEYTIILGREYSKDKVIFKTKDLINWKFDSLIEIKDHYMG